VWEWRASDHIPLTETQYPWTTVKDNQGRYDAYHWNSIEWTGDGFLVSFRHMNAVYKISRSTGAIDWKLGG